MGREASKQVGNLFYITRRTSAKDLTLSEIINIRKVHDDKKISAHKEMFILLGIRSFTGEQVHFHHNEKISSGK